MQTLWQDLRSLVLLVGAGLMMRTFAKINQLDWGFNPLVFPPH